MQVKGNFDIDAQLISGQLTYPTADGTPGQVVVTDGAGQLDWANGVGMVLFAATTISKGIPIQINSSGEADVIGGATLADTSRVVGLALGDAVPGGLVTVGFEGHVADFSSVGAINYTPGQTVYVTGNAQTQTSASPSAAWTPIGKAISAKTLVISRSA